MSSAAPDYATDMLARRKLIETTRNPDAKVDYVSTLEADLLPADGARARVVVRYVPDRRVLSETGLPRYLEVVGSVGPENLETAATLIVADLADQLVPRWIQVFVQQARPGAEASPGRHEVLIEERQPKWRNDELLSRLGPP